MNDLFEGKLNAYGAVSLFCRARKYCQLSRAWSNLPKDYKTELNNMFRNPSVMALLPQNVIFQFANANILPSQQLKFNLSRMIRPLDFTSYVIPLALNTMMIACSPLSQKDVRQFISQLLKPPSLKLPTLFSADKKNLFIT